jgi:hypothetical protein
MFRYRLYAADGRSSARPELAAEQLDKAGALPPGERADGLARADAGDGEEVARFDRADLRHRDE